MPTHIESLSNEQAGQLSELIKRIVATTAPEKIICYGCRTMITRDWGCFGGNARDGFTDVTATTFDLLLIVNDNEKRLDHDVVHIAEQLSNRLCHLPV